MPAKFRIRAIDKSVVYAAIGSFAFGALLMLVPLIVDASFGKLAVSIVIIGILLMGLWSGLTRGSYITIDENNNLYGTVLFMRGRTTQLSEVTALATRGQFMGGMTGVTLTFRDKDSALKTRGVVSKSALKREDLKKLIEAIRAANPNIKIPEEVLK